MAKLGLGVLAFVGGGAALLAIAGYLGAFGLVIVGLVEVLVVYALLRASERA